MTENYFHTRQYYKLFPERIKDIINIKYALCIKDGFLANGYESQFCIKGKKYAYHYFNEKLFTYEVMSEGQNHFNHSMKKEFFDEYFREIDFIEEREMEI